MKTCFISMPFGRKSHEDGRVVDFDLVYTGAINPAVEAAGLNCARFDDFPQSVTWQQTLVSAVVASDLMIVDITTYNPNVFYELGIRHALSPGRTIVVSAGSRIPFDINYISVLHYELDGSGRLTERAAADFRQALQRLINQAMRSPLSDSPIHALYPGLQVLLPPELQPPLRALGGDFANPEAREQALQPEDNKPQAVPGLTEIDLRQYLDELKTSRATGNWDEVIALANEAPALIARTIEVRQTLALALNRRRQPGDQERAIKVLEEQLRETEGEPDTLGILGRIYRDLYNEALSQGDRANAVRNHDLAIETYRTAFARNSGDYYLGLNLAELLLERGDDDAELAMVVLKTRKAIMDQQEPGRSDIWGAAANLELSIIEGDWDAAERAELELRANGADTWLRESLAAQLRRLAHLEKSRKSDRSRRIGEIVANLTRTVPQGAQHG